MIFHTSADPLYIERFYQGFTESINKHCSSVSFSLNIVGEIQERPKADIITEEYISLQEIKNKFNTNEKDTLGYYCLSRWLTIPSKNDHVCVCDIDILAIDKIDIKLVENLLETYQAVNLTRIKPNGNEGGMMIIFLHKEICKEIKNYALNVLKENKLTWDLDVKVREYIYANYKIKNLLKMQEISKPSSTKIDNPWFIFSKIEKFKNLI